MSSTTNLKIKLSKTPSFSGNPVKNVFIFYVFVPFTIIPLNGFTKGRSVPNWASTGYKYCGCYRVNRHILICV